MEGKSPPPSLPPDHPASKSLNGCGFSLITSFRKIGQVLFHPTAANVVAAAGGDHTIKLWDIEAQSDRSTLTGFTDSVQSLDFDWTGTTLAATSRDRKLRIFDPRAGGQAVQTADGHPGVKGSRLIWCGSTDRIATTGFSKTSDRQLWLWDSRDISKPLKQTLVDTSSGVVMPFWSDNSIIFLAGKGDGNVRYYELESDELHPLSEYKSTDPQRGMTFLPRRDLNADENEIARAYKLTNNMIQPISFICPRKADSFQADIFPPAPSSVPALTSQEFFNGKTALPNLINLQDGSGVNSRDALPSGNTSAAPSSITSAPATAPAAAPTPSSTLSAPAPAPAATPTPVKRSEPLPEPTRLSTRASQPAEPIPTSSPTKATTVPKSTLDALRESDPAPLSTSSSAQSAVTSPAPTSAKGLTSGIGDVSSFTLQEMDVGCAN